MSKISFTLIQTFLHWEDKQSNLKMLEEKIKGINNSHIIILPEMFSTAFSMNPQKLAEPFPGPTHEWMQKISKEKNKIITGSMMVEENGEYYNRLVWMLPNGEFGFYDKRHLFAYAKEDEHYAAGQKRLIASVSGWKINLQVCYDLRFPVWSRQQFSKDGAFEYDVLIFVANWPARRSLAWRTLLQARAIENQCYVIGVNRVGDDGNKIYHSGDSMVVDPLGEVLYHKADEEDIHTVLLDKDHLQTIRDKFQFWRDADRFEILP